LWRAFVIVHQSSCAGAFGRQVGRLAQQEGAALLQANSSLTVALQKKQEAK